ncbi:MAG: site-specific integrase [Propionibacteriaceae bacterium]|jgi:integrase|nr:site-specific integrase [Propionibacteriaceae bacterium]
MARGTGWGKVRRLPSGKYQASYVGSDLLRCTAPETFITKLSAQAWLDGEKRYLDGLQAQGRLSEWLTPKRREELQRARQGLSLAEYAARFSSTGVGGKPLATGTQRLNERLLRIQILPTFGHLPVSGVTSSEVASWWHSLPAETQRVNNQAYALLKSLFSRAVEDGIIAANPCKIRGAGTGSKRRVIKAPTPAEVARIADAWPESWRLGVLIGAWCGLRSGEVRELRRKDIDLDAGVIHVTRQGQVYPGGLVEITRPKTDAGIRDVPIPPALRQDFREHLDGRISEDGIYLPGRVGSDMDALLFHDTVHTNQLVHHGSWLRAQKRACKQAGVCEYTFHDMRRTAVTYLGNSGASETERLTSIGHTESRMTKRYEQIETEHQQQVMSNLSAYIEQGRQEARG